jgi:hypothetical protein
MNYTRGRNRRHFAKAFAPREIAIGLDGARVSARGSSRVSLVSTPLHRVEKRGIRRISPELELQVGQPVPADGDETVAQWRMIGPEQSRHVPEHRRS